MIYIIVFIRSIIFLSLIQLISLKLAQHYSYCSHTCFFVARSLLYVAHSERNADRWNKLTFHLLRWHYCWSDPLHNIINNFISNALHTQILEKILIEILSIYTWHMQHMRHCVTSTIRLPVPTLHKRVYACTHLPANVDGKPTRRLTSLPVCILSFMLQRFFYGRQQVDPVYCMTDWDMDIMPRTKHSAAKSHTSQNLHLSWPRAIVVPSVTTKHILCLSAL